MSVRSDDGITPAPIDASDMAEMRCMTSRTGLDSGAEVDADADADAGSTLLPVPLPLVLLLPPVR